MRFITCDNKVVDNNSVKARRRGVEARSCMVLTHEVSKYHLKVDCDRLKMYANPKQPLQ